jgi:hypothetical protein
VRSMPQVSLIPINRFSFTGGDTGSIPVRDAKAINHLQEIPFSQCGPNKRPFLIPFALVRKI